MKITLCGILKFFEEIKKIKEELEEKGHEVCLSIRVDNTDYNNKTINYVGGNSFLEMGFAHVNNKKIFILNSLPKTLNYTEEMMGMSPVIINGNFDLIK